MVRPTVDMPSTNLVRNKTLALLNMPSLSETTGCVISLGTEFQMGVAQKWAKPGPQKFL